MEDAEADPKDNVFTSARACNVTDGSSAKELMLNCLQSQAATLEEHVRTNSMQTTIVPLETSVASSKKGRAI